MSAKGSARQEHTEAGWETRMRAQTVLVPTAQAMRDLGMRLAGVLRAGDLVVLSGGLGAGKTTLTQGIGEGLKVRGPITSPTFVIAREHPSLSGGPPLVHADAYRLGGLAEVDDLDLDASLDAAVTVVEWGEGLVDELAADRLEVEITLPEEDGTERVVRFAGIGDRWAGVSPLSTYSPRNTVQGAETSTERGRAET
jgi:tRNA threonylcarbamoyladenosine biosynthesis protein TsaE